MFSRNNSPMKKKEYQRIPRYLFKFTIYLKLVASIPQNISEKRIQTPDSMYRSYVYCSLDLKRDFIQNGTHHSGMWGC